MKLIMNLDLMITRNYHALQWDSDINKGEIEWTDKRNEKVLSEDEINDKLGINLTTIGKSGVCRTRNYFLIILMDHHFPNPGDQYYSYRTLNRNQYGS